VIASLGRELGRIVPLADSIHEIRLLEVGVAWPEEISDQALMEAVRRADGVVAIGFRPVGGAKTRDTGRLPAMSRATALGLRGMLLAHDVEILQTFRSSATVLARVTPERAVQLRRLPFIDYLEPEQQGSGGQGPPAQVIGWQIPKIGADLAWSNYSAFGQYATITILDSGIDSTHRVNSALDGPESVNVDCLYVPSVSPGSTCYHGAYAHGSGVAA
jgi:hypothetical protein